jgi:hypothetical protein
MRRRGGRGIARGERVTVAQHFVERAGRHDLAPVPPRPRAEVDDVVGRANRLLVMLHDQHRVPEIA